MVLLDASLLLATRCGIVKCRIKCTVVRCAIAGYVGTRNKLDRMSLLQSDATLIDMSLLCLTTLLRTDVAHTVYADSGIYNM